jgi:hypothetical protein
MTGIAGTFLGLVRIGQSADDQNAQWWAAAKSVSTV